MELQSSQPLPRSLWSNQPHLNLEGTSILSIMINAEKQYLLSVFKIKVLRTVSYNSNLHLIKYVTFKWFMRPWWIKKHLISSIFAAQVWRNDKIKVPYLCLQFAYFTIFKVLYHIAQYFLATDGIFDFNTSQTTSILYIKHFYCTNVEEFNNKSSIFESPCGIFSYIWATIKTLCSIIPGYGWYIWFLHI